MALMLAAPGQVEVGAAALVQGDEQVRAVVPVPYVYPGRLQLLLCSTCQASAEVLHLGCARRLQDFVRDLASDNVILPPSL